MLRVTAIGCFAAVLLSGQAPRHADLMVRGGTVLTMDPEHRIIGAGFVAIENSRIIAVGPLDQAGSFTADRVIDATGRAVLPGLINLHTQSSMILMRGLADDYSLAT